MQVMERQGQRQDARRNREAVIEAAIELLGQNPGTSVQQIADASGVGRTTVYRHFPSRDDLIRALFERVVAESWEVTDAITSSDRPAEEILRELVPAFIELGLKFGFLSAHSDVGQPTMRGSKEVEDEPVARFLVRAQRNGEIRADLPLGWMRSLIQALAVAAVSDLLGGLLERDEAERLLGDAMADALLPR